MKRWKARVNSERMDSTCGLMMVSVPLESISRRSSLGRIMKGRINVAARAPRTMRYFFMLATAAEIFI